MFSAPQWGSRLAWSRLVDLGSIDSGSNPGSPTNNASMTTSWFKFCRSPDLDAASKAKTYTVVDSNVYREEMIENAFYF
jgi:hypothetical protein